MAKKPKEEVVPWPFNWSHYDTGHLSSPEDPVPYHHRPDDTEALWAYFRDELKPHTTKLRGYFDPEAIVEYAMDVARREE